MTTRNRLLERKVPRWPVRVLQPVEAGLQAVAELRVRWLARGRVASVQAPALQLPAAARVRQSREVRQKKTQASSPVDKPVSRAPEPPVSLPLGAARRERRVRQVLQLLPPTLRS
jgi:hypothetical protein